VLLVLVGFAEKIPRNVVYTLLLTVLILNFTFQSFRSDVFLCLNNSLYMC